MFSLIFFFFFFFLGVLLYIKMWILSLVSYNHNKFKRQNQIELTINCEDLSRKIDMEVKLIMLLLLEWMAALSGLSFSCLEEFLDCCTFMWLSCFFLFFLFFYSTLLMCNRIKFSFNFFNKSFLLIKKKKINCYVGRETIAHTKPICKNASKHLYEWGNHNLKQIFLSYFAFSKYNSMPNYGFSSIFIFCK